MNNIERFLISVKEYLTDHENLRDSIRDCYNLTEYSDEEDEETGLIASEQFVYCLLASLINEDLYCELEDELTTFTSEFGFSIEKVNNPIASIMKRGYVAQCTYGFAEVVIKFLDFYVAFDVMIDSYGHVPDITNYVPQYREVFPQQKTITVFE